MWKFLSDNTRIHKIPNIMFNKIFYRFLHRMLLRCVHGQVQRSSTASGRGSVDWPGFPSAPREVLHRHLPATSGNSEGLCSFVGTERPPVDIRRHYAHCVFCSACALLRIYRRTTEGARERCQMQYAEKTKQNRTSRLYAYYLQQRILGKGRSPY